MSLLEHVLNREMILPLCALLTFADQFIACRLHRCFGGLASDPGAYLASFFLAGLGCFGSFLNRDLGKIASFVGQLRSRLFTGSRRKQYPHEHSCNQT